MISWPMAVVCVAITFAVTVELEKFIQLRHERKMKEMEHREKINEQFNE